MSGDRPLDVIQVDLERERRRPAMVAVAVIDVVWLHITHLRLVSNVVK